MLRRKGQKFPKAKQYKDFRKLLEEMENQIDAVTVSTPDHCHGVAAITAMAMGQHAYVPKPLAQTVWESRIMRHLARRSARIVKPTVAAVRRAATVTAAQFNVAWGVLGHECEPSVRWHATMGIRDVGGGGVQVGPLVQHESL